MEIKNISKTKLFALGLGGLLGLSHLGMIGIIANKKPLSKFPQLNIPVSEYTSYSVQANEEGYAINYRANDPLVMATTKIIPGKGGLFSKVKHAVDNGGAELELIELDYKYLNGGAYFNASDDEIDRVDFNVQGERVKISLFKGATEYVLADGTNADSAKNLKPTNMSTNWLGAEGREYTKVGLRLTNTTGEFDYAIGVDFPLSQASGTFSASITEYDIFQEIGLTRCLGDTNIGAGGS